jgi:rubredoxin
MMAPVILAVTTSRITSISFDDLVKLSTQTILENVSPNHSIYVYIYGVDTKYSVTTDEMKGQIIAFPNGGNRFSIKTLEFPIKSSRDLTGILPIPGLSTIKELEVLVPSSQNLKRLKGAQRYGPVLFTKIKVVDEKTGTSNLWPLCILLNAPTILGVTRKKADDIANPSNPKEVYANLLKENLATLVKGTTPGSIQRGSNREDPPQDVFIYGCNFINPKVRPAEIAALDHLLISRKIRYPRTVCTVEFDFSIGPLQKKFQFALQEIAVSLPTMADLQDSDNYLRNAMLMAFGVKVLNDNGRGEESNTWQWPMWLPMPIISAVEPDKKKGFGNGQYLAKQTSNRDQGEVRWYFGSPFNDQKKPLEKCIQGIDADLQKINRVPFDRLSAVWNFPANETTGKKTIVLPQELVNVLREIREAGELCLINQNPPNHWSDDTVIFDRPFEKCYEDTCGYTYDPQEGDPDRGIRPWTPFAFLPGDWVCPNCGNSREKFVENGELRSKETGFAVVWRGDIPSLPLPINLVEYVKELAKRLWRPVVGNGVRDYTVPVPIPVGEVIHLGVERLEDVSNELLQFIKRIDGLTVQFAFLSNTMNTEDFRLQDGQVKGLSTEKAGDRNSFFTSLLEPGKTGIADEVIKFIYNPTASEFYLQLHILIGGKITLFGKEVIISQPGEPGLDFPVGPRLRFCPEQIKMPTVAIFFEDRYFKGRALVAFPSGTGLFGEDDIKIDAQTQDDQGLNQNRFRIVNQLAAINGLLDKMNLFLNDPALDRVSEFVGRVCSIGGSLMSSKGSIQNLGEYCLAKPDNWGIGGSSFANCISSAVVIGLPYSLSKTKVICWEGPLTEVNRGRRLELPIPDAQYVYTVDDFRYVTTIPEVVEGVQFGEPNGFNDAVKGIEFANAQ